MRIERVQASPHKKGRVLVFLEDGACLKITEQELSLIHISTRAVRLLRRTFWRQIFRAPSDHSPSTTRAWGTWAATASPMQPLPAHRSSTRHSPKVLI